MRVLRPVISASYSDSLFVAENLKRMACWTLNPSGLVRMTPAPLVEDVDDPSVNRI